MTRIVLTPEVVPKRKLSEVRIDLQDALAGILHLAAGAKAAAAGVEFATAAIERRQEETGGSVADDLATTHNAEEPAWVGRALACVAERKDRWLRGQDLALTEPLGDSTQ